MYGPIALCCISPKEKTRELTEIDIYGLFKNFADMKRMLIFQREPSLKCFIEFSDTNSFENALRNIGKVSTAYGKPSLYQSKKDTLKNAFDLTEFLKKDKPNFFNADLKHELDSSSTSLPSNDSHLKKSQITFSISPQDHDIAKLRSSEYQMINSENNLNYHNCLSLSTGFKSQKSIKYQTDFDLKEQKFVTFTDTPLKTTDKIRIMMVQNIDLNRIKINTIKNVLGCFGNVSQLIVNKQLNHVLAEFESPHQANLVHIYLNDTNFFGCDLTVYYVSALCLQDNSTPLVDLEFHRVDEKFHKFKKHLSIKFNPPSTILHFTSLSERIDHIILYSLISQIHEPVKMYKLVKKSSKSDMYLVEFNSVSESFEVLAVMHNKIVDNKSLKISFSHPEI
jgi:hypothetical protein